MGILLYVHSKLFFPMILTSLWVGCEHLHSQLLSESMEVNVVLCRPRRIKISFTTFKVHIISNDYRHCLCMIHRSMPVFPTPLIKCGQQKMSVLTKQNKQQQQMNLPVVQITVFNHVVHLVNHSVCFQIKQTTLVLFNRPLSLE